MGLIDEVLTGEDVESSAIAYAQELQRTAAPLKRVRDITIDPATVELDSSMKPELGWQNGHAGRSRKTASFPAEAAVSLPMDAGLARERELFGELVTSPESAAMRHIFFAERLAAKIKNCRKIRPPETSRKWPLSVVAPWVEASLCALPEWAYRWCWLRLMTRRWSVVLALSARITHNRTEGQTQRRQDGAADQHDQRYDQL